jgi:hypothetical protein
MGFLAAKVGNLVSTTLDPPARPRQFHFRPQAWLKPAPKLRGDEAQK